MFQIRKPLMEKRRRARINKCLNEMQQLLSNGEPACKPAKMEKADILEMTVQYLKQVKLNSAQSLEHQENNENHMKELYNLGFEKCLNKTKCLIEILPGINDQIKEEINSHMKMCLENLKNEINQYTSKISSSKKIKMESCAKVNKSWQCQKPEESPKHPAIVLQGYKDFSVLPSKLLNGDVILIISPDINKNKCNVWRPW